LLIPPIPGPASQNRVVGHHRTQSCAAGSVTGKRAPRGHQRSQGIYPIFADNPQLAVIGYFEAEESQSLREEVTEFVARNVIAEQKSGYFRSDFDAAMMAECYNGSLDRLIRRHLLTGTATVDELADLVVELFLRGVRSDPHERR
jgi:hypothetical protein